MRGRGREVNLLARLRRLLWPIEPWDDPPPCECSHARYEHQLETTDGACGRLMCGCRRYQP